VPAIYFHGLIGTENDPGIVHQTNSKRDINRRFVDEVDLLREAKDPNSKLTHIRRQFAGMLKLRVQEAAFHPSGTQQVLDLGPSVFAVLRSSPDGLHSILSVVNITQEEQYLEIPLPVQVSEIRLWTNLISNSTHQTRERSLSLSLRPYEVVWMKADV
jgi:sucrose phosphorylase